MFDFTNYWEPDRGKGGIGASEKREIIERQQVIARKYGSGERDWEPIGSRQREMESLRRGLK